ncbi:hypothetical protein NM208_g41 [Fusarium decemcellulare]|uniref:Uncharacterized protein n=1 Tax=Fusarium decemcellulare TaxID=57161 RepID=A0ACC1T109_9HYPO|nr:hypothetical protein NM208_g41 [Fusarium decemcellulare]
MEPIGLAVGVVGLAGLFSTCLDAVNRVQAYKSFGIDSHVLATRFQAAQALLDQWGLKVGFAEPTLSKNHHPALDEQNVVAAVEDVLRIITGICESNKPSLARPGLTPSLLDDAGAYPFRGERRRKLYWALGGKGRREDQVELLETLVRQLHSLVPLNGSEARTNTASDQSSVTELQQILARIEEKNQAEIRREVLTWIGRGSADEHYHDSLQKKLDGTCNWIFNQPMYQDWQNSEFPTGPKLLWVNGPAGFGKTVLCASVIQQLSSRLKTPIAHFFFSSELENRDDPFLAIRSWISQVVLNHQAAFEHARETWVLDSDAVSTRRTAISLFKQLIDLVPNCTFIADGLDECTHLDNTGNSVGRFLHAFCEAITGTETRVLLVSRDEPEIRYAIMEDAPESFNEYKISASDVQSDTAVYSRFIIDRKLPNKSDDARSLLSKAMADRCEGQFLWLKMQEKSLRKGMNMKKLRNTVEETPPGLDAVYDRSWSRIKRSPECERIFSILRWAAFALRPLSVFEITEAVLIDNSEDLPIDDFPDQVDDDYVDTEIVGLCGPLIQVRSQQADLYIGQQTVHLTHFSVKQFLLLNLPTPGLVSINDDLRAEYQNTLLAKACLFYIKFRRTWAETMGHPSSLGNKLRNYASGSWHRHLKSGIPTDKEVSKLALEFLNTQNEAWNPWREWFDERHQEIDNLEDGTNPTLMTRPGPIYYAVKLGLNDMIGLLIKRHNYDFRKDLELSALEAARGGGCRDVMKILLDAGAGIATADKSGRTLLYAAVQWGQSDTAKLLIERGASVTTPTKRGTTPLHVVKDIEMARLLIERGASVVATSQNGATPLHHACLSRNVEVVNLFLDQGASLTAATLEGWTPLLMATHHGYTEMVRLLIERGACITVTTQDERTALHISSENGHVELSKLLIDKGADTMAATLLGHAPLHLASRNGHLKVVKLLIERGASIVIGARGKFTPLHTAAEFGALDVARFLIEKGASIEGVSGMAHTPLQLACMRGHLDLVKLLIEHGANIVAKTPNSNLLPLHLASRSGHEEVVKLLLATTGIDPGCTDELGVTALLLASRFGFKRIVETMLVDARINPNAKDWHDSTALFAAVRNGHLETAELLLGLGRMSTEGEDAFGRSLFWWGRRTGNDQIVQLLRNHAERDGSSIPDDLTLIGHTPVQFDSELPYCDAYAEMNDTEDHDYGVMEIG